MVLAHDLNQGKRTRDIQSSVDVTFDSMLLSNKTLEGLVNSGFYRPSPIQLHGIPLGKCGFDLFLEAKSGTGKTAVFTVIALEKLNLNNGLQAIILAPTREIAAQISDVIKQLGSSYGDLTVEVVMGGLPLAEDIEKLQKNVHILVGSPGRMRHLIQDQHIKVSTVRLFILDECDKLMDKSFQADINYIFSALPKQKQVIMSSATYPSELKSVLQNYVKKVQHICPDSTSVLLGIKQFVTTVKCNINIVRQTQNRFQELLKILSSREFKQCLIFCNYQVRVGELCKMLIRDKWPAEKLHGQLEQTERLGALRILQEYKCRILVSTDLAARGIDASNVDLVINFEPPGDWQTYLHRIGRAGRFGSYGIAITILSEGKEKSSFIKLIKNISSLTLNNLWDDSTFELNSDTDNYVSPKHEESKEEEISEIQVEQPDADKELLDSKTHNVIENIGSGPLLTKLFDSFDKPKECKIESFGDLIASFQAHEPDNNNEITEVKDVTFRKYFDTVLNVATENEMSKENVLDSNSNSNNEQDRQRHTSKELKSTEGYLPSQSHSEICKDSEVNKETTLPKSNDVKSSSIEPQVNCHESNYISDTECHKALIEAGLPTSFSSSKYCNRSNVPKHKNNNSMKNKRRNNIQPTKETHLKQSYKSSSEESQIYIDDDGYNTQSCLLSRSVKSNNNHKPMQSIGSLKTRSNVLSSYSESSHDSDSDIHNDYMIWYNQLKSHVKQVEMYLYIDELSKV
ncbi:putative ATP-dependent RNA helicase DDX20 [Anticarsia gemmatalis]|uniref:putative ATP-dependent RNA helicase DDX20 n=1 Tax=Anticarsia gemmatalis TaxID=129554 RepID=UPI003F759565